ncbi:unnamed protein product [Moneuplotes crassus]|uniref:Right handed beta helix domain-containing protein n=1 Tax=Euplotes crassus TaxID=5936 RepID=A0AAD1XA18_EUPCR|nr:unnamed protein product [Moneuplotes crassus]
MQDSESSKEVEMQDQQYADDEDEKEDFKEDKKENFEEDEKEESPPSGKNNYTFSEKKKKSDKEYKQINVDSGAAPGLSNHYPTITKALEAATPYTVIKITSGNYRENVKLKIPYITLEPKEKCGEVTIVSGGDPCLFIDLPKQDDYVVLDSIKIKYNTASTKEDTKNPTNTDESIDPAMLSQFVETFEVQDRMKCIVNIKKGNLYLGNCKVDFEGSMDHHDDIFPCIVGQKNSSLIAESCTIKGDSLHEANTIGVLMEQPSMTTLKHCLIEHHLDGGIILNLNSESLVDITENEMRVCKKVGIFIQGEDSLPSIEGNFIKLCLSPAIVIGTGVSAMISKNNLYSDKMGVVILNSKSTVYDNKIKKSHEDGIQVRCLGQEHVCCPTIKDNEICESNGNGILIEGDNANPKILNNIVDNNKKCGVILKDCAQIDTFKKNSIRKNYTQGVLIVEGCSAIIEDNTISMNLKANIAYGGQGSQNTKIINNVVSGSVAEGIFVVEGHENTVIVDNKVEKNKDGIVLYNSKGSCKDNTIRENQRSGILVGGQTSADISNNILAANICFQILIKDPRQQKKKKDKKKLKELYECNNLEEAPS